MMPAKAGRSAGQLDDDDYRRLLPSMLCICMCCRSILADAAAADDRQLLHTRETERVPDVGVTTDHANPQELS